MFNISSGGKEETQKENMHLIMQKENILFIMFEARIEIFLVKIVKT